MTIPVPSLARINLPLIAQDDLADLTALLRHTAHGWAFALYDTAAVRDEVTARLRAALAPVPVHEVTLTPDQPNLLDHLLPLNDAHSVVIVHDLERLGPEAFDYLDFSREALAALPHTLVFWVTLHGRIQTVRKAANFWAQRSGTFDFTLLTDAAREWRGAWAGATVQLETADDLPRLTRLYTTLLEEYGDDARAAQRADLHGKLAYLYNVAGRYDEALSHLRQQLALGEQLGDHRTQAQALNNLGELEGRRNGPAVALDYYERALALADDAPTRGETLVKIASTLIWERSDYTQAEALLHEALSLLAPEATAHFTALLNLGKIAEYRGEYGTAEKHYHTAREWAQTHAQRSLAAEADHALGRLAQFRGDYVTAQQLYRASLQAMQELGDKRYVAVTQHALGDLARLRGDVAQAETLYRASLNTFEELGDKKNVAVTQHALGDLARLRGDFAQAETLFRASLKTKEQLGDKRGVAVTQNALGHLAQLRGDYTQAETLFSASLKTADELGARQGIAATLYNLALLRVQQERLTEALELLASSRDLLREIGSAKDAETIEETIREIQSRLSEAKVP